ncbi:MAG: putative RNA methyltransferase, partial [Mycobacteriales bacterium]
MTPLPAEILTRLTCPICGGPIDQVGGALRCPNNHSFDVARQGYVTMLAGNAQLSSGDTAAMVEHRDAFLRSGRYGFI